MGLRWTNNAPTAPGVYWTREDPHAFKLLSVVRADKPAGALSSVLFAYTADLEPLHAADSPYREWAGPIPEPEEV